MTRVMVIEDTESTRELLQDAFADRGWEVRAFSNIADAELALASDTPDLLLSDVHLPDGEAVDLVRRLRAERRDMPVVLISGEGSEALIQVGFDAGADDFLTKPLSMAELITKCLRHTARSRVAPRSAQPPLPGSHAAAFGRYRIVRELGQGAQAIVYEAEDLERGDRVALKVLSALAGLHPVHRGRFLKEAYALSAIDHPSVARLRDFGCVEGRLYCALELIEGTTLPDARASRSPLEREVLDLMIALSEGLRAAHDARLVHRDVKPENVLLRGGRWDAPVLVDFGLAKQVCDRTATCTGMVGTPGYVAPELVQGAQATSRSDIWSLGALAWSLLEGREPFPGREGLALLQATISEPLPRTRRASPALAELVERMTAIDPAQRPGSCEEISLQLRAMRARASR